MSMLHGGRRIFISYARDDDEPFARRLCQDLEAHGFSVWWDREAMESRGRTFLREIRDAISAAERLILVVGQRARHKPYVTVEWRHALREGVVVTPVLRLGDYDDVPEALRALHCEDVRAGVTEPEAFAKVRRIVATPVPPLGGLDGVPRLPTPFLERSERLDALRSRILIDAYDPIDLQPDQRITSLTGMGGAGKSVLAAALAHAPDVRRSFQDGIHWITVGRDADPLRTLTRIGNALGDAAVDRYTGIAEARLFLGRAMAARNLLIVLDDVWEVDVAEALHTAAGKGVRILLTGRKRKLFASAGVHEVLVDEMTDGEALDLLAGWTDTPRDALPAEAAMIARECGNLPLALAMIGATIRGRPDRWRHALERLRAADLSKIGRRLPDYEYEDLDRAMLVSFEDLSDTQRERYLDLAAIPEDVAAPAMMLRAWWTHEGVGDLDATDLIDALVDRSLLRGDDHERYTAHDVQRDFLMMRVDVRALHERWLAAFAAHWPDGWASAEDDGYLWDNLEHHLGGAGREDEWRALLSSFAWLERKTALRGFPAVLLDLAVYADHETLGPLHRACRGAAHVLTNDPAQLAAQLIARIDVPHTHPLSALLEAARAWRGRRWLRPLNASLGEAGEPTIAVYRGREEDGHAGTPRGIAISHDASLIASSGGSSNDLTLKIWSAAGAGLLRSFDDVVGPGGAADVAFVSAVGHVATAVPDEVRVYSADAGEPVARRRFDGVPVARICPGPRPRVVLIGCHDGGVLSWDSVTDRLLTLREPDGDGIRSLAHAAGAPRFACATGAAVECRSAEDGRIIGRIDTPVGGGGPHFQAPPLVMSRAGGHVFFATAEATAVLSWMPGEPAAPLSDVAASGPVVAIAEDGALVLTAPTARELTAVATATGERVSQVRNSREFSCLALAPDGRSVVTADFEHDVKLWDLTRPETTPVAWRERGRIEKVAMCDAAGLAFVASENAREIWNAATGGPFDAADEPDAALMARRGQPLLDAWMESQIREQLTEAVVGPGEDAFIDIGVPVGALAFSHGAGRAVSAPRRGAKYADMEEPPRVPGETPDYPVHLWEFADIREARLLHGHTSMIMCADMTRDGTRALTGSWGRVLRLWDLETGTCLHVLRGHRGIVFDCALTDDARLAVSGSEDMTVRVWDLAAGRLLFTFGTSSAVTACDIARDGSLVLAGESSGRVHILEVR